MGRDWRIICETADSAVQENSNHRRRLHAATLRASFALMISAGIRHQELAAISRRQVDLAEGLIRVEGKKARIFVKREKLRCRFSPSKS